MMSSAFSVVDTLQAGGVWAPALSYADGQFWLIYTDVKVTGGQWKDCHNYLVTCETIDGQQCRQ